MLNLKVNTRGHAFMLSDPNRKITNVDKINILNEIVELQRIAELFVNRAVTIAFEYAASLSRESVIYLTRVTQSAQQLISAVTNLVEDVKSPPTLDINVLSQTSLVLSAIWNKGLDTLENDTLQFMASINETHILAKHNLTNVFLTTINDIRTRFSKIVDRMLNSAGEIVTKNEGFGLKFYGDIEVFGLKLLGLDIEFVYCSGSKLSHCDRFEFAQNILKNERAIRIIGVVGYPEKFGRYFFIGKGAGVVLAMSLDNNNFAFIIRMEASLFGFQRRVDTYILNNGVFVYLEGKIWNAFKAQLEVSFERRLSLFENNLPILVDVSLNVKGRFIADADGDGDFSDSYLSSLIKYTEYIADEADKRISDVQGTFTSAQRSLSAAQNWLEDKEAVLRSANVHFDNAVRAMDIAKVKLEEAKRPFQNAIDTLEIAQRNVDRLCKIRT
ncbi:hypothetical protein DPMN_163226 [Dreissena polymorpha]|uniref:Uncharacterized protein n=1 Tax=Dreissena polymorpha TaxID=45954 RepID=A0A9D4EVD3_DREPO|nr:hypothetical protein DPMN_163226 [Dreissena polymorpha]